MKTKKRKWILVVSMLLIGVAAALLYVNRSDYPKPGVPVHTQLLGQLNMEVPEARNTPHPGWTKLDYYKQADADSAKRKADQARDPYYVLPELDSNAADAQADALTKQLDVLNKELHKPAAAPKKQTRMFPTSRETISPDVRQLQAMMHAIQRKPAEADPEMEQLNGMLEKIMDIQHPERVINRKSEDAKEANGAAYAVMAADESASTGFYSLAEDSIAAIKENAFGAVIAEGQTLVSGSVIRLRLTQEMLVNGHTIGADELVVGTVRLNGERLLVDIQHVRAGKLLLPVKLSVYDADGLPGIYIPGAITRDVAKQSAAESMSSLGLGSFDPSIGAQATSAGIQAAKTLLQKKVQQVRVTVPAAYAVFLKNI
jgi:conjugative transposon TraM protein